MQLREFHFKQFTIRHQTSAMKVGTDGVLLGAWAKVSDSRNILDVGTGSGLIALMLAQRSHAHIHAIDIAPESCLEATENILHSPWPERVQVNNISLQAYYPANNMRYDTIVSNPPYFQQSLPSPDTARTLARHDGSMTLEELFRHSARLLLPHGQLSVILPAETDTIAHSLARRNGLHPVRITYVKPNIYLPPKRMIAEYRTAPCQFSPEVILIETSQRHSYSEAYKTLTRDFYLKF